MKKVVLLDLYDTVLKDVSFNFTDGIIYLYKTFFSQVCSQKDMMDYANSFMPLYDKRKVNYTEVCLIKDEIPLFFEKFGVVKPDTFDEIDYAIMNQMQKVTIINEVRYTLNELQKQGVTMYILSNSIFTSNSARKLLNCFEILHYFERVYSSADYGIRKPCSKFYQIAIKGILSDNPNLRKEDILYVGNDYVSDVIGATSVGLNTVWYNIKHLPNEKNISVFDIDDFKKILEITGR